MPDSDERARQQIDDDARRRAPHGLVLELEEVEHAVDRRLTPVLAAERAIAREVGERDPQHALHFGGLGAEVQPLGHRADLGNDVAPCDGGMEMLELTVHGDQPGVEPDFLVRLAQRRGGEVGVLGVAASAGERDLAGVAAEVVAALGEDRVQLAVLVEVERGEDGGLGAAVDVDGQRRFRREQRAAELLREYGPGPQASSTRSSNTTSPSSVR